MEPLSYASPPPAIRWPKNLIISICISVLAMALEFAMVHGVGSDTSDGGFGGFFLFWGGILGSGFLLLCSLVVVIIGFKTQPRWLWGLALAILATAGICLPLSILLCLI